MAFDDTQRAIRDTFRRFMVTELEPRTAALEAGSELPYPLMRKMIDELGLSAAAEELMNAEPRAASSSSDSRDSPGRKLRAFIETQLMVEMCRINPGYALSVGASLGLFGGNVRTRGTPEQVRSWAVPVLRGEKIGAWGLTEPEAGSNALGAMRSTARRSGGDYVLNGTKTFITNAPYADYFLVYAKDETGQVQAFFVERGTPGLSTSPPFAKMGMKSSPTGAIYLEDVRVPESHLLGGGIRDRDHVRKSLATERIGLAVMSYGIAERCFEIALDYAKNRVQGGQPIANYQLIQNRLARMYVGLSNARRIVYDAGSMSLLDVCAGKLYVAEVGTQLAFEAIHILGGNGYMEEYVVERLARDAKLVEIGGGTTEMQILTIAKHLLADGAATQL